MMRKEQVEKYLIHYITHPPNLDEHDLKYFRCVLKSNEDYLRSLNDYELYGKFGLTRFLHFVLFHLHNPSHF